MSEKKPTGYYNQNTLFLNFDYTKMVPYLMGCRQCGKRWYEDRPDSPCRINSAIMYDYCSECPKKEIK